MALVDQMIRASRLDVSLYEEVEHDKSQTTNALTVVAITAAAAAIGSAISAAMATPGAGNPVLGIIGAILMAILGWAVWTGCVYFVGTRLFGGTATWGEVLRTVGFADSPNVLMILSFIPILGGLIALVVWIWTIVTTVVAVRQSLDISTGKAVVASIIGAIAAAILIAIIAGIFSIPGAMVRGLGGP